MQVEELDLRAELSRQVLVVRIDARDVFGAGQSQTDIERRRLADVRRVSVIDQAIIAEAVNDVSCVVRARVIDDD
jgi:hypothetical protein